MWMRHIRGKGGKVDREANSMKGGTHSKLIEDLCNETYVPTIRASIESQQLPALSTLVHVDESGHRVSF